jgi:hypothetical protein
VWPFGTTWSDDESAVILPDHSAVPIGSTISAGGGYLGPDQLDDEQWVDDPETVLQWLSDSEALERVRGCVEYDGTDKVFLLQEWYP